METQCCMQYNYYNECSEISQQNVKYSMKKKISVIIPIYNVGKYLEKCIDSVISQTYRNLEIILVDDGSTDESNIICDDFARRDERIIVIHQKNVGLVNARKAGLAVATGQYIGFVDGDDYIDSLMYEALLEKIEENDADIVHMGFRSNLRECISFNAQNIDLKKERVKTINRVLLDEEITPSIWSKLFKRDVVLKAYAEVENDVSFGEDLVCFISALLISDSLVLIDMALYNYRVIEDSMSHCVDKYALLKELRLFENIKSVFEKYSSGQEYCETLRKYICAHVANGLERSVENCFWFNRYEMADLNALENKRVIIYGAGKVGKSVYSQIARYKDIDIVAWVDKNNKLYDFDCREVEMPIVLSGVEYDYVVIAVKSERTFYNIKQEMIENGLVDSNKVIWANPVLIM